MTWEAREAYSMISALVDLVLFVGIIIVFISNMQTNKKLKKLQVSLLELKPAINAFSKAVDTTSESIDKLKSANLSASQALMNAPKAVAAEPKEQIIQQKTQPKQTLQEESKLAPQFTDDNLNELDAIVKKALENEENNSINNSDKLIDTPEEIQRKKKIVNAFFKMADR